MSGGAKTTGGLVGDGGGVVGVVAGVVGMAVGVLVGWWVAVGATAVIVTPTAEISLVSGRQAARMKLRPNMVSNKIVLFRMVSYRFRFQPVSLA